MCRGDDARGGGAVAGLGRFKRDFLAGVAGATAMAMLARPKYLIMGLSLEHIVAGIEPIRATMGQLSRGCDLSWATWHDAAHSWSNSAVSCSTGSSASAGECARGRRPWRSR